MRFLFVSNFIREPNSGSAGSLVQIGNALSDRGHVVDFLWRSNAMPRLHHGVADTVLLLPRRQFRQVRAHLRAAATYDVVDISQPYAYGVYERLPAEFPRTLFLNRTHGWEERARRALLSHGEDAGSAQLPMLSDASHRVWSKYCVRTAQAAHGIVTPSSLCAEFIMTNHGVSSDRIKVIPHGADDGRADSRESPVPRTWEDPLRLLFAGNYLPLKGSRLLDAVLPRIAAISSSVEVTFVVPERSVPVVRAAFEPTFGRRVTVLPWLKREQLSETYRRHDVYLSPSLFEGFGLAAIEAMRAGLCVVGSDEGALRDIALPGHAALLFPPGDSEEFQQRLELCLRDRGLVRRVAEEGQEKARDLTWARTAELTEQWCLALRNRILGDSIRTAA